MADPKTNIAAKPDGRVESAKDAQENVAKNEGVKEGQRYDEMREQMLRLAAEFDNYKKRTKKEIEEAEMTGKALLVRDMLPIIDEFEIAMLAVAKSDDKDMARGVEMLYLNLMDALRRSGLGEVKCDGIFDPFRHEIVMVQDSDKKDGTILGVVKKGYEFRGRMLRPASVIVAKPAGKNGGNRDESDADEKTKGEK
jgi:molecular chaperone GrpE